MRHSWLLFVIVLMIGMLPLRSVTAQSACSISTQFVDMPLRSGPGTQYDVVTTMRLKTDYAVTERVIESLAKGRIRVWYHLVPGSAASDVWVGGRVETTGDCENIATTRESAPEAPTPVPVLMPLGELDNWSDWSVFHTGLLYECASDTMQSLQEATLSIDPDHYVPGSASVAVERDRFTVYFEDYTMTFVKGRDGRWRGIDTESAFHTQGVLSVESPTRLSGELINRYTDEMGMDCVDKNFIFMVWQDPNQ